MNHRTNSGPHEPIHPTQAIAEAAKIFWHLRAILFSLLAAFTVLSAAMYYFGGPIETATRAPASPGQLLYFCSITALTIGYGDVIPTTMAGRVISILLGLIGVTLTGMVTAVAVSSAQAAARRIGIHPHDENMVRTYRNSDTGNQSAQRENDPGIHE